MRLDDWQSEVLACEGNLALRAGRQVGKSTVISIKAAEFAVNNRNKTVMIISSVERQAGLLFEKTLNYIYENHKSLIKKGKERPTKHKIVLNNGSVIHSLPCGLSGYGIRGFTIDLLIADEAAFIPEEVWAAVTPMLAVTKGNIILLSTPFGKGGFFYRCFSDTNFKSFHISSEDCPRKNESFLAQEKKRMSKLQYAQEYLGEFVDELRRFFPDDLITKCLILSRNPGANSLSPDNYFPRGSGEFYLGVDIAGQGGDQTVLLSVKKNEDFIKQIDMEITEKTYLTETTERIIAAEKRHGYNKIYIDDGGMGFGVFSSLLKNDLTRRKVVPLNNSSRSVDSTDEKHKKILKEDLYNNLLVLMEKGSLQLFNDEEIALSLKSVQYEYDDGKFRIFGNNTHIVEALVRAVWFMNRKVNKLWIF